MSLNSEHAHTHATVCNALGERTFKRFAYVPIGEQFRCGPCGSITFTKINEDEAIAEGHEFHKTKFELSYRCAYPWPPSQKGHRP